MTGEGLYMLVVSLAEGDYIMIGDKIRVHFDHKVSRDSLSLGIEAPRDIQILRGKLCEGGKARKPGHQRAKKKVST